MRPTVPAVRHSSGANPATVYRINSDATTTQIVQMHLTKWVARHAIALKVEVNDPFPVSLSSYILPESLRVQRLVMFTHPVVMTAPGAKLQNCRNTTACIHPSWICDGANDCWDNSDEQNCTSPGTTSGPSGGSIIPDGQSCPLSAFQCRNGKCITSAWLCDRDDDCEDAVNGTLSSDEINCDYTCRPDQFKCNNSDCIPSMWRCDGTEDCADGSGKFFSSV